MFWGLLGVVIGLICCGILGVVFGILSIRDARRFGRSPVIGWVAIALSVINIVASLILNFTKQYPGVYYH
jgi:general stress protein CsbA